MIKKEKHGFSCAFNVRDASNLDYEIKPVWAELESTSKNIIDKPGLYSIQVVIEKLKDAIKFQRI